MSDRTVQMDGTALSPDADALLPPDTFLIRFPSAHGRGPIREQGAECDNEFNARNWMPVVEKKRQSVGASGVALYVRVFPGFAHIKSEPRDYNITLKLPDGEKTTIHVRSAAAMTSLLDLAASCVNRVTGLASGELVSSVDAMDGEYGSIFPIGYKDSSRGTEEYAGTSECRQETKRFVAAIGKYLYENLPEVSSGIEEAEQAALCAKPPCPSFEVSDNRHRCGNTLRVTANFGSSYYFDGHSTSQCCSLWISKTGQPVDNWKLVFPHASLGSMDTKGVVISLHHGSIVTWHGGLLKHCMTVPNVGDDGEGAFGLVLGSSV